MTAAVRTAEAAALVGDPARANILAALLGGRTLMAGELVYAAGMCRRRPAAILPNSPTAG